MRVNRMRLANLIILVCARIGVAAEPSLQLDYVVSLPNIEIDGRPAPIHTQGLFVDDQHFYVTGRLEVEPKRPLLIRFEREHPEQFSLIDLSLTQPNFSSKQLDHPGGFDFDGTSFWIPVARSRPQGPSAIVKVTCRNDLPFEQWTPELAFESNDHIGAIAYRRDRNRLYGANWDTKRVYVWSREGTTQEVVDQNKWIINDPDWQLAVQDWKSIEGGRLIVAGGIDKSHKIVPSASRAVVDTFESQSRKRISRVRLADVDESSRPLTNEGLCWFDKWLVLLPGDIGRDAKVYFFRKGASP